MPSPETLHLPIGGPTSATPLGESATEAGAAPSDRRLSSGDMVPGCGTHSGNNASGGPSEGGKKGNKPPTEPFALAESLPMIPATLVDKILKGQYVDMCDLLQDNILLSKKSTNGGAGGGGGSEPSVGHTQRRKREFTKDESGLLSWIQCFAAFTAIVCSQDPTRCNDLLAYMVIMVNEARRFKYQGWLTYDEMFRQSAAKSKSTTWANLNGTLYATTFLSQQKGESVTCRTCSSLITIHTNVPYMIVDQHHIIGQLHHPRGRGLAVKALKKVQEQGFVMHGMMGSAHGAQAVDGGTMCA